MILKVLTGLRNAYMKQIFAILVVMLVTAAAWRYLEMSWRNSYTVTTGVGEAKMFRVKNNLGVHKGQRTAKTGKH